MASRSTQRPDLAAAIRSGDRATLAKAITLIESTRADHRGEAHRLVQDLLPATGRAVRLGITGAPGVGKSTTIDALGSFLTAQGHKVAVLAVDPSSSRSGGSILGDKTRMQELARAEAAFIRPSPAGGSLGGVARRTREALLVCEAAGFDVVIVETVGVGQSETAVADMVDIFVLLLQPGGGDELQGFKRGIMELADLFVVTKADGELAAAAGRAAAEYRGALGFLRPPSPNWRPPVLTSSALEGSGMAEVWDAVLTHRRALEAAAPGAPDALAAKRARQAKAWMWREVNESLLAALKGHPAVAARLPALEAEVAAGTTSPTAAARRLLAAFRGDEPRDGEPGNGK